jgi:fumarylacetoacetase
MIYSEDSDFSLANIPFGIGKVEEKVFACTRVGDWVVDLDQCQWNDVFEGIDLPSGIFGKRHLNSFISLGKDITKAVRERLQQHLADTSIFIDQERSPYIIAAHRVTMLLPIDIGDYTDFYSSKEHAYNVGVMFRDPANALLPNWLHIPIGYHGRASSIVVSGTEIKRPHGQTKLDTEDLPTFGASKQVDFELEMGFVIGKDSQLGDPIGVSNAADYIFGLVLFNDWSARDIQKWEYVPLGPFLGKNFGSTVSPWIVTLEALEQFKVEGPVQDPAVLPYLQYEGLQNYDINLSVDIVTSSGDEKRVSNSNFKYMYWNMVQQLAHHTSNGCNVRVGDLLASGTISGPTPDSYGSMLEIAWKGTKPVTMPDGTERKFVHNGDTVRMRGYAEKNGIRVGFGECDGTIVIVL